MRRPLHASKSRIFVTFGMMLDDGASRPPIERIAGRLMPPASEARAACSTAARRRACKCRSLEVDARATITSAIFRALPRRLAQRPGRRHFRLRQHDGHDDGTAGRGATTARRLRQAIPRRAYFARILRGAGDIGFAVLRSRSAHTERRYSIREQSAGRARPPMSD